MALNKKRHIFTSESVTEGHPDKISDQISDAVLDAILEQDPSARVACETAVTTGMVLVMGEITTRATVDIRRIVRDTISDVGFTKSAYGFDANTCAILTSIDEQSPDIALGVDQALEVREKTSDDEYELTGAGDQGLMFGYATDETPEYMPLPIALAHRLARRLAEVRKNGTLTYLRPDGKTQVSVVYEDGQPVFVDTIVISTQHDPEIHVDQIRSDLVEHIISPVLDADLVGPETRYLINPTGRFVVGGPAGDAGLTGRKIIVDTYGGMSRHGGGAFSGKDPTKVDRSASYAARHVAKNIVAAGLAKRCEVQVAYAIGVARPVSIAVDTFGTGNVSDGEIVNLIRTHFDLRPAAIIERLGLRRPIYRQVAAYGHFGRPDLDLPWEQLDVVDVLRQSTEKN